MKSHKQISQRPKKSMKIPLGKLIRQWRSKKHEVAQGLIKKGGRAHSQSTQGKKAQEP